MALADDINNEVKNLDLNNTDDMQAFQKQRDSWVQKIEGKYKHVYNDTAKIPQKTVDHGFNMDSPGADKLWNKAFENYSGPKPDFNKVIKGIDDIDKLQIDHLYKHVVQSKEQALINKIGKENWSKLKPNERLALESANYNSPSLIGKKLTGYIQDYAKAGSADDLAKAVKELQSNGGNGYPSFNRDLQPRRDAEAKLLAG